jgi:hypothetical protein
VVDLYDEGQSRPWALVSAGRYVAVGTVPHNGATGGLLALVDPDTGRYWTERIAGGHSVVGLAYRRGVLYGATSVYGGAGAPRPTATDAVVFAYDVRRKRMLWQVTPRPGEGAFGEVAFDKDGHLWGAGPTSVFELDPRDGSTLAERLYADYPWSTVEYAWVASRVWVDPFDDQVYVTAQAATYRIDPETLERARVFRPASYAITANDGSAYVGRDLRVWRWQVDDARPSVDIALSSTRVRPGERLEVTVSGLGPGEPVELWLRPHDRRVAGARASADGVVTVRLRVPPSPRGRAAAVEVARPMTRGIVRAPFEITAGPH